MKIVNEHIRFPPIDYEPSNTTGYLHLAAEIEHPLPIKPSSRAKKRVIARAKELCERFDARDDVVSAHVLEALVIPPGNKPGRLIMERDHPGVHIAKYDLVVQIEATNVAAAKALRATALYEELVAVLKASAKYFHAFVAENARKIGEVDKTRPGIFLYNYFYASDPDVVLPVWEYTGRWFAQKTGLDNSTLLRPADGEQCEYAVINHCRWDSARHIIPHLICRPSLRPYVLENFTANGLVAIPILYKLA